MKCSTTCAMPQAHKIFFDTGLIYQSDLFLYWPFIHNSGEKCASDSDTLATTMEIKLSVKWLNNHLEDDHSKMIFLLEILTNFSTTGLFHLILVWQCYLETTVNWTEL